MASRERLGHLKFMQRAKLREEEKAKQDEAQASSDHWISDRKPSGSSCVVIVEGDPKPSNVSGRMSFRSFNPSFEILGSSSAASSAERNSVDLYSAPRSLEWLSWSCGHKRCLPQRQRAVRSQSRMVKKPVLSAASKAL